MIRILLHGYEPKEKPDTRFYEAMRQLSAIGNNINQLAVKANTLGFIDTPMLKTESKDQVRRYIRLTYLIPELLEMVDENKIAFNPAVEISYLEQSEQRVLLNAMELNDCTPSHAQAIRLKKLSQEGVLQDQTIYDILAEQKPNQQEQYKFKREDIRKYFPKSYTDKQVCDTVIKLLEQWQRRRERDRDSR